VCRIFLSLLQPFSGFTRVAFASTKGVLASVSCFHAANPLLSEVWQQRRHSKNSSLWVCLKCGNRWSPAPPSKCGIEAHPEVQCRHI
jgi:hypothetical protein